MTDKSKTDAPQVEELSTEDLDAVAGGYPKIGDIKGESRPFRNDIGAVSKPLGDDNGAVKRPRLRESAILDFALTGNGDF